ncbi:MAG: alpha/beta fold hydrolase [Nocardioidaceae bacterium]
MTDPTAAVMTRHAVDSDGLRLAVFETSRVGPTIVFVHGFPDTHAVWDPVIADLRDRFHCVAYDVRGAGESEVPSSRGQYALSCLVTDLVAVLDVVSPDRPVHVVGHDWGSVQAWDAVVREKSDPRLAGRISSYTTISGPCLDHVRAFAHAARRGNGKERREGLQQLVHSWYIFAFQVPWLPELALRNGYRRLLAKGGRSLAHFGSTLPEDAAHGLNLYRANLRRRSRVPGGPSTDLPVLLVVALRDNYVLPQLTRDLHRFAANLTRAEIDAGHWVPRSHSAQLASIVAEFVSRHDGDHTR